MELARALLFNFIVFSSNVLNADTKCDLPSHFYHAITILSIIPVPNSPFLKCSELFKEVEEIAWLHQDFSYSATECCTFISADYCILLNNEEKERFSSKKTGGYRVVQK